jgi:hypothetical protein
MGRQRWQRLLVVKRTRLTPLLTAVLVVVLVGSVVGSAALMDAPQRERDAPEHASAPPSATSHAIGTIVSTSERALVIEESPSDAQDGPAHTYRISTDIRFCRRTCSDTRRSLRRGDFIDGWLDPVHRGQARPKRPVYVNMVADRTLVDSVAGNVVTVRTTHIAAPQTPYKLHVQPTTVVVLPDGSEMIGTLPELQPGDPLYYLGGRERPNGLGTAWAYTVLL